ncbi:YHYH domain-containing protein [Gottfriedia acidiceleris]|uniref:YHYH domain-containing protein n=1 Tax=Gottfriedia acidiceleris TaxID=371036 RepID=UPI00101CCE93|nr:YHYH domain-containing protein [Gottfriedia acidiceleris]
MRKVATVLAILLVFVFQQNAYAHSGRTDANGGHNCSAKSQAKGLCTGYHYHNGGGSTSSGGSSSSGNSNSTWDKDCSDFSSYDEVVEYWNKKGYTATYDPERLDGWGNVVDDGIPCEVPSGYDTSKINGSPEQIAKAQAVRDSSIGEKAGYSAGLSDGEKGNLNDSSTSGSDAYQEGFGKGYETGYKKGAAELEKLKFKASNEGYTLGKKQDTVTIPKSYLSIKALKDTYQQGFNKALTERYTALGFKDGKSDVLNDLKNDNAIIVDSYKKGYEKGQAELKKTYVKQGYDAAFKMVKYKQPKLKSDKYIGWYREGFSSNKIVKSIAKVAFNAGLNGESNKVPEKYTHADVIYQYNYVKGEQEKKENNRQIAGTLAFGVAGWLGRRFYVAKKMLK